MMTNDEWLDINDWKAVAFVRSVLPASLNKKVKDLQIGRISDIVYAFFETNGLFEEDKESDEFDIDEDEVVAYVLEEIKGDPDFFGLTKEEIQLLVDAELDYCNF